MFKRDEFFLLAEGYANIKNYGGFIQTNDSEPKIRPLV